MNSLDFFQLILFFTFLIHSLVLFYFKYKMYGKKYNNLKIMIRNILILNWLHKKLMECYNFVIRFIYLYIIKIFLSWYIRYIELILQIPKMTYSLIKHLDLIVDLEQHTKAKHENLAITKKSNVLKKSNFNQTIIL